MFESRYKYNGVVKADFTPMTPETIAREIESVTQQAVAISKLQFLNRDTGKTMTIPEGTVIFHIPPI